MICLETLSAGIEFTQVVQYSAITAVCGHSSVNYSKGERPEGWKSERIPRVASNHNFIKFVKKLTWNKKKTDLKKIGSKHHNHRTIISTSSKVSHQLHLKIKEINENRTASGTWKPINLPSMIYASNTKNKSAINNLCLHWRKLFFKPTDKKKKHNFG